jgi:hypothetical protein
MMVPSSLEWNLVFDASLTVGTGLAGRKALDARDRQVWYARGREIRQVTNRTQL